MNNFFLLATLSTLITSCVNLDGNLIVSEKITLKKKGGFLNLQKKDVSIEANEYQASLKIVGANNYTLELNQFGNKILIPIKSKNNLNMPKYSGPFKISHNDIAQPYDVKGIILTDIQNSSSEEEIVSCTYFTQELACHQVCEAPVILPATPQENPNREGHRDGGERKPQQDVHDIQRDIQRDLQCRSICDQVSVANTGSQWQRYHYTTTHRDLKFDFLKADLEQSVASFQGENTEIEKIIETSDSCHSEYHRERR